MLDRFGGRECKHILLVAVLLLSWGLMTCQLDRRSLWVDEFATLQMIRGSPSEVVAASLADVHPPLYFVIMNWWVGLFGSSDFALRLFSVACAMLGLSLMPGVASRLAGPRAALPAAFLLGIAPAFLEFSQMARYYAMVLALGLLSTKLLLDALDQRNWRCWLTYALAGLALVYTFYLGGLLIVAHVLLILLHERPRDVLGRWLVSAILIGLGASLQFVLVAGRQMSGLAATLGADLSRSPIGFVLGLAATLYTFAVGETLFPWQPAAWAGGVAACALLVASLARRSGRAIWRSLGLLVIGMLLASLAITFIAADKPFLMIPVRVLFLLPYYVVCLALGLLTFSLRWRVIVMAVLLCSWSVSIYNNFVDREPLNPIYFTPAKEAAAFVRHSVMPDDLIISDLDSVFGHYYLGGEVVGQHRYTRQVDEIRSVLQSSLPERVWLVTIGRDRIQQISSANEVRQLLRAGYRLERTQGYLPIDATYQKIKTALLKRRSYQYRLTIELYVRVGGR